MPLAEKLLWFRLRGNTLLPLGFERGQTLGSHYVDFYSPRLRCALEIHGCDQPHVRSPLEELKRSIYFTHHRIRVIRLTPQQIFEELDEVIANLIQETTELSRIRHITINLKQPYAIQPFNLVTPSQHPA